MSTVKDIGLFVVGAGKDKSAEMRDDDIELTICCIMRFPGDGNVRMMSHNLIT
jgi:hypothetical protein